MLSSDRAQRAAAGGVPRTDGSAAPAPPRLRERNKQRKRAALVRAGRALFAQRGFDETTTRAIAAKAGVASGTFFLYFREKRDLLFHIFKEEVTAVLDEAFVTAPRGAPLVDRLVHVFSRLYAHYARNPRLSRVFMKELVFLEEGESYPMMALTMSFVLRAAELVAEAKGRGEVRPDADPMIAASQAMASYLFCLVGWFNGVIPSPELTVAQLEAQLELLMQGLGRRKRR